MPRLETFEDLLVHQLRDAFSAERQQVKAMPKLAKNASTPDLRSAIKWHLEQTKAQMDRLEQVFALLGVRSRGPKCKAMKGLIREAKDLLHEDAEPSVLDLAIIAMAQRVEHYEIAVYGTCIAYARRLGRAEVVALLEASLNEERTSAETLTELAEIGINAMPQDGGKGKVDADESDMDSTNGREARATKKASKNRPFRDTRRTKVGAN